MLKSTSFEPIQCLRSRRNTLAARVAAASISTALTIVLVPVGNLVPPGPDPTLLRPAMGRTGGEFTEFREFGRGLA